jgi:hypothetical protein
LNSTFAIHKTAAPTTLFSPTLHYIRELTWKHIYGILAPAMRIIGKCYLTCEVNKMRIILQMLQKISTTWLVLRFVFRDVIEDCLYFKKTYSN